MRQYLFWDLASVKDVYKPGNQFFGELFQEYNVGQKLHLRG